jgi:hypothetical protein
VSQPNKSPLSSLACPDCRTLSLYVDDAAGETVTCDTCNTTWGIQDLMMKVLGGEPPVSDLQMGAVQCHELFEEWCNSGWTERQSLYIVGCLLTGNPGTAPRSV